MTSALNFSRCIRELKIVSKVCPEQFSAQIEKLHRNTLKNCGGTDRTIFDSLRDRFRKKTGYVPNLGAESGLAVAHGRCQAHSHTR